MTIGWAQDFWLVAIGEEIPAAEVRLWWNSKNAETLDVVVDSAPGVYLGTIITSGEDPEPSSQTRRVFDLRYLRGTLSEQFEPNTTDSYVMSLLNRELETALLTAFQPHAEDHLAATAVPVEDLAWFLQQHTGLRLLPHRRGEAIGINL